MFFTGATVAGSPDVPNEDWVATTSDLVVMLDGATVRTETGCRHGAAWYTRKLGAAIIGFAAARSTLLREVLASAICEVATLHDTTCDLAHPGTPSAAVGIARLDGETLRYLVLGDITIVLDTDSGVTVVSDQRISASAATERAEVDLHLIGTPEKADALIEMKHAELAARNTEGGYWISAADPSAACCALTGEIPMATVRRLAVLTDGAARAVDMFSLHRSWLRALDAIEDVGPDHFLQVVREMEASDPLGARHPRNKVSDDATVILARMRARQEVTEERSLPPIKERIKLADEFLTRTVNAPGIYGDGNSQRATAERALIQ
jgi:hypothetical protein